jgi:hypothetical protein
MIETAEHLGTEDSGEGIQWRYERHSAMWGHATFAQRPLVSLFAS